MDYAIPNSPPAVLPFGPWLRRALAPMLLLALAAFAPAPGEAAAEAPAPAATTAAVDAARILTELLGTSGVTARAMSPTTVVVQGTVNPVDAERIRRMVSGVDKTVSVIDALTVAARPARQLIIRSRIVDINLDRLKDLGIEYGQLTVAGGAGGAAPEIGIRDQPFLFGLSGTRSDPELNLLSQLALRLHLLAEQDAARILSEPNIVVMEGSRGSILVGGELPIPVVQTVAGTASTAVTIQYKPFGVQLTVEPLSVGDNGEIALQVIPEVSILDFANAVQISGFNIPALRTRREETSVRLVAGQTLAIGGLISNTLTRTVRKIPGFADLPILGQLFRSRHFERNESELVILLTPEIVAPGSSPMPTALSREAPGMPIRRPDLPASMRPKPEGVPSPGPGPENTGSERR